MRDHLLNWQLPAQPLAPAIRKQTEPAVWPFPLASKAPTFVADCRTMDSDRPQTEKPAQAEPQADAEGWVVHDGNGMPEQLRGKRVQLWFSDGDKRPQYSGLAEDWSDLNWVGQGEAWKIARYRLVPA